jgi:hypothetical protein
MVMLPAVLCGLFPACNTTEGGTEIPNELTGREYIAGAPAANARIRLIPVGYVPGGEDSGKPILDGVTDAEGNFTIKDAAAGQYNILASKDDLRSFRDSVGITGKRQGLGADTLTLPGSLTGWVALQPQHEVRTATVQVLGTTHFVNVGADGKFLLTELGAGQYRLRVVSIEEGYVPLFREISIREGRNDTLTDTLRPFYYKIPVVTGIKASALPDGIVNLTWNKTSFAGAESYMVYREPVLSALPSLQAIGNVRDTVFSDTLYGYEGRPFQYLDSASHAFRYRVKIVDRSGAEGPYLGGAETTTIPPARQYMSGKWRRVTADAGFPERTDAAVVAFKDKLWIFGGRDGTEYLSDVWNSADGATWTRSSATLPMPSVGRSAPVVFKEKLWMVNWADYGLGQMLTSEDGLAWTLVARNVPSWAPSTYRVFKDRLSWLSGSGPDMNQFMSSPDGITWDSLPMPKGYSGTDAQSQIVFKNAFWRIGGADNAGGMPTDIWKTLDGINWVRTVPATASLPRREHRMTASDSTLWAIGGGRDYGYNPIDRFSDPLFDQVWSTKDGSVWTLVDAHAPFGQRIGPAVTWFKGRVWVIGGTLQGIRLNDVWSMEAQ